MVCLEWGLLASGLGLRIPTRITCVSDGPDLTRITTCRPDQVIAKCPGRIIATAGLVYQVQLTVSLGPLTRAAIADRQTRQRVWQKQQRD